MAQNQRRERQRQEILSKLNHNEHKHRTSIITFLIIEVLVFIFAEIFDLVNHRGYEYNLVITSAIGVVLGFIWILSRFGILEGSRLKARNWRNKKLAKNIDGSVPKMTLAQHREYISEKSWYGPTLLIGVNIIIAIAASFI